MSQFSKLLAGNPRCLKKYLFARHYRANLRGSNPWQDSVPDTGAAVLSSFLWAEPPSLISKVNSQGHGFPLLFSSHYCQEMRKRKEWRGRERSYVVSIAVLVPAACHSCYSRGLFLMEEGGKWERVSKRGRGEILLWCCKMRNDTVSPNVAPHRPVMD